MLKIKVQTCFLKYRKYLIILINKKLKNKILNLSLYIVLIIPFYFLKYFCKPLMSEFDK